MKISLNWIKDFVEIDPNLSADKLAKTITLSVCEVEGFETTGAHLMDVLVSEVVRIEQHPDADKLSLVTVNYGHGTQRVVCGASNFKIGDKVPFAGEGVVLPGDFKIKKTKIRGVESCGMLCAEDELGFSDDHEGLMILEKHQSPGMPLSKVFPDQIDVVLEIDNKSITHRPDLWGHYGFARELGAIYKKPVKSMELDKQSLIGTGNRITDVEVVATDLVPRFTGLSIDRVQIGPSPVWIQHRLLRVGLRPINNMVDLTNYVMLELGQPMHAFDASTIAGNRLIVRRAEEGTRVMTLHGKEVELDERDLTICDDNGASVVAGVVGGEDSGVKNSTTTIFLEAANWDPVNIRKTSTRINLRTDASKRFEKSLDPEMTLLSIQRAVEFMKLTSPNLTICGEPVDIVSKQNEPVYINVETELICRRLGKEIEENTIKDILTSLGFSIEENGSAMKVGVPSYRRTKDVSIQEDLIEEIGRIYGFNNIEPVAPMFPIDRPVFNLQHQFERSTRSVLSGCRYHEVVNYPLTCQKAEVPFGLNSNGVMKLINPVADHQDQMRTSLLPHFVQSILDNQKITYDFKLYEFGRIYWKDHSGDLREPNRLIAGVSKQKTSTGEAFYQLKHDLLNLFSKLQIDDLGWSPIKSELLKEYQHKFVSARLASGETEFGTIYGFSPEFVDILGIKEDVCVAELDFDLMFSYNKKQYLYEEPPKYPAVNFELSIMVSQKTFFETIRDIIFSVSKLVKQVEYLDTYQSKDFNDLKSMSVSIEFRSPDKTLEPGEVTELQDSVVQALADKGYRLREA